MKSPTTIAALAIAALAWSAPARAQEPPKPQMRTAQDAQREMIELFGVVERKLRSIDKLLYDAGAGEAPADKVEDGGIERLLRNAADTSREAQAGIERILELARQMENQKQNSPSSGQGQGQPKDQQGNSPLDQKRSDQQKDKDSDPQGLAPRTPGEEQKQPKGQPKDPKSDKESKEEPTQRAGGEPPKSATERTAAGTDRERWGDLPIQVRDVFRSEGGGDLPPQYRDWIDAYYKRLNQRP
jgi:hypothetical protein